MPLPKKRKAGRQKAAGIAREKTKSLKDIIASLKLEINREKEKNEFIKNEKEKELEKATKREFENGNGKSAASLQTTLYEIEQERKKLADNFAVERAQSQFRESELVGKVHSLEGIVIQKEKEISQLREKLQSLILHSTEISAQNYQLRGQVESGHPVLKMRTSITPLLNSISIKPDTLRRSIRNFDKLLPFSQLSKRSSRSEQIRFIELEHTFQEIAREDNFSLLLCRFLNHLSSSGSGMSPSVSVGDLFMMKTKLQWSWHELESVKHAVSQFMGFDPFPSIDRLKKFEKEISRGEMFFYEEGEESSISRPDITCGAVNVQDLLNLRASDLYDSGNLTVSGGKFRVTIMGDKGGSTTKLAMAFGDIQKTNSPYTLQLLGVYTGSDRQSDMKDRLGSVTDQINTLKEVVITRKNGSQLKLPVELFLTGDYKFLCECYGHKGSSTAQHCLFCDHRNRGVTESKLRLKDLKPGAKGTLRTVDDYIEDSKEGSNGVRLGSKVLFPSIPLENVIPPSLHLMMGVVTKYVIEKLVELARKQDSITDTQLMVVEKSIDADEALERIERTIEECRVRMESVSYDQKRAEAVESIWQQINTSGRMIISPPQHSCDNFPCISKEITRRGVQMMGGCVRCPTCSHFVHLECVGVVDRDRVAEIENGFEVVQCLACAGRDNKSEIRNRIDQIQEYREQLQTEMDTYLQSFENIKNKIMGPRERGLEKRFNDIGAARKAYHKKSFTGNHIYKILSAANVDYILEALENCEQKRTLEIIMKLLSETMRFSSSRNLDQHEADNLENVLIELTNELQKAFPDETITPKLHVLLNHVVPFVRKHGTWGKTSEQSIESFHRLFAQLETRYNGVKNLVLRYKSIVRHVGFYNYNYDNQGVPAEDLPKH